MPKPKAILFALWIVLAANAAHAYTRAYVTNNTGQAEYTLHVKLDHPAAENSAGADYGEIFGVAQVSPDGMNLTFTDPLNADGIAPGQVVWIGWSDANSQYPADIVSYYWTDQLGNIVGGVQTPPPGDNGDPSQQSTNTLGSGPDSGLGTTTSNDPGTNNPGTNDPGTNNPGNNTNNPGNTIPGGTGNQSGSVPEPASAGLVLAAGLFLAAWKRR